MEVASSESVDIDGGHDDNFTCDICADQKSVSKMFKLMGCTDHSYCTQCIAMYVCSKLQDNISRISCPGSGCNGLLEPHNCRSILTNEVFDKWGDALCEAMISESEKFYCPLKDCSALLIKENNDQVITESECPGCKRLICAKCKVAWHSGIECEKYQDENETEGIQLIQLAKSQEWQRCPSCKIYVARSEGCAQMKCRCGCDFCYQCGAHTDDHYCSSCGSLRE